MIKPVIRHDVNSNVKCIEPIACIIDKDNTLFLELELIKEMNMALNDPTCWVGICLEEHSQKAPRYDALRSTTIKSCKLYCEKDAVTFEYENEEEFRNVFLTIFYDFVIKSKDNSLFAFNITFESERIPRVYQIKLMCEDMVLGDKGVTFKTNNMYCSSMEYDITQVH